MQDQTTAVAHYLKPLCVLCTEYKSREPQGLTTRKQKAIHDEDCPESMEVHVYTPDADRPPYTIPLLYTDALEKLPYCQAYTCRQRTDRKSQ